MNDVTKDITVTSEQAEAQKEKMRLVAEKLQKILVEDDFALQPYLQYTEHGLVPRVRLVDVSESKDNATEETNTGESEGGGAEDSATQS